MAQVVFCDLHSRFTYFFIFHFVGQAILFVFFILFFHINSTMFSLRVITAVVTVVAVNHMVTATTTAITVTAGVVVTGLTTVALVATSAIAGAAVAAIYCATCDPFSRKGVGKKETGLIDAGLNFVAAVSNTAQATYDLGKAVVRSAVAVCKTVVRGAVAVCKAVGSWFCHAVSSMASSA